MKRLFTTTLTLLAGAALGGVIVGGLKAQGKTPGAYAIVDISEVTDPEGFKQILAIAPAAAAKAGGKFIIHTNKIVALDGTAPARYVVIAFDSVDQAKAWNRSDDQKKVDDIRTKTTKSRAFIAEGM